MSDYTVTALTRGAGTSITQQAAQASALIDCAAYKTDKLLIRCSNPEATSCRVTIGATANGLRKKSIVQTIAQNEIFYFAVDADDVSDLNGKIQMLVTGTTGGAYGGTIANIKFSIIAAPL